jgi:hypothetical protein
MIGVKLMHRLVPIAAESITGTAWTRALAVIVATASWALCALNSVRRCSSQRSFRALLQQLMRTASAWIIFSRLQKGSETMADEGSAISWVYWNVVRSVAKVGYILSNRIESTPNLLSCVSSR